MNEILIWFVTGIVYAITGRIMIRITINYLDELENKVSKIDVRYVDRMYYRIEWEKMSKTRQDILTAVLRIFWPVVCIMMILKAEKEYSIIRNHCYRREAP